MSKTTVTTIRLRPEDREALEAIKEHYALTTLTAAIRLAARQTAHLVRGEATRMNRDEERGQS